MTCVTLVCRQCGATTKRDLAQVAGCRGVRETASEGASCPLGHGPLVRASRQARRSRRAR